MSILSDIEQVISKAEPAIARELSEIKAFAEGRLTQVPALLAELKADVEQAITDAAEAAAPGLRADLAKTLADAEAGLKEILGLK